MDMNKIINELTPEEKKSSLEAPFWEKNVKIDKNTPFMKKIEEICKDVFKE